MVNEGTDPAVLAASVPAGDVVASLTTYRLSLLANLLSKHAASLYDRCFGVTLGEWRVLAVLHDAGQLSLTSLAAATNLDKGQASRVVSALLGRGLVHREPDRHDGRGIALSLSDGGDALFRQILPLAHERNRRLLDHLDPGDVEAFDRVLGLLTAEARTMWRDEKAASADRPLVP